MTKCWFNFSVSLSSVYCELCRLKTMTALQLLVQLHCQFIISVLWIVQAQDHDSPTTVGSTSLSVHHQCIVNCADSRPWQPYDCWFNFIVSSSSVYCELCRLKTMTALQLFILVSVHHQCIVNCAGSRPWPPYNCWFNFSVSSSSVYCELWIVQAQDHDSPTTVGSSSLSVHRQCIVNCAD